MKKNILLLFFAIIAVACAKVAPPEEPVKPDPTDSPVVSTHVLTKAELCEKVGITDPMFIMMLPNRSVNVDVYQYETVDAFGRQITASGIATYPVDNDKTKAKGIVLAQHFTYGAHSESPSKSGVMYESLIALFGYVVVAPDYIGYGSSVEVNHPYHHIELTGRASVDMLEKVRSNFAATLYELPSKIKMVGYSQGAHAVMAAAKYMDDSGYTKLTIDEIFAGAGAYDLVATCNEVVETDYTSIPSTVPMIVLGLDYGDRLALDMKQTFKEPLLSNYKEWILSKKFTLEEISAKIGSTKISDILAPEFFDLSNDNTQKIRISLAKNSVVGAGWAPKGKVYLYHSNADTVVPYINSTSAYAAYQKLGCDVKLTTIEGKEHFDAAIEFYAACLSTFMQSSAQGSSQNNAQLSVEALGAAMRGGKIVD